MKPWLIAGLGAAISLSCRDGVSTARRHAIEILAESDPGVPLRGVEIFIDGTLVGATGEDGLLETKVGGEPERPLKIEHDCPLGHAAPSRAKHLRLRPLVRVQSGDTADLRITLECRPEKRLAVFVVRAGAGLRLPVMLDGQLTAQTNASGVAHLFVSGAPGTEYEIELDTTAHPLLMPQSPRHHFTLPDAHEVFVVNQSFELESAAPPRRSRRKRILKIE